MTLERMEYLFDTFDQVAVMFSGGKDSTVCVNLAAQVAADKKRLPLRVITFDEEAIPPETVEYCQRVSDRDDIDLEWYCVPIEHRNACSSREPYWYPWAPEDRAKWVRDLPKSAITQLPSGQRSGVVSQVKHMFDPKKGSAAQILGIRTQESMSRYRQICNGKAGNRAYIIKKADECPPWLKKALPIYDWKTEDVWLAPQLMGWDYNRAYEKMTLAGLSIAMQRCSPPYGEQPIRQLWVYKQCWPELWDKMVDRVHGAATAARYANTDLYGCGVSDKDKVNGKTWKEMVFEEIDRMDDKAKKEVAEGLRACMVMHSRYTDDAIPDEIEHEQSGFSWKSLYTMAKVGGNKFNRQSQKLMKRATDYRIKAGIPQL